MFRNLHNLSGFIFLLILFQYVPSISAKNFKVLPQNTTVGFSVQYLKFWSVEGCFNDIYGGLVTDSNSDRLMKFNGDIVVDSLWTGIDFRDNHLMSESYFDQVQYPTIHFESQAVTFTNDHDFEIQGIITIKGISKPVVFKGESQNRLLATDRLEKISYTATGIIDRYYFKIGPADSYYPDGFLISRNVEFTLFTEICLDELDNERICPESKQEINNKISCSRRESAAQPQLSAHR